MKSSLANLKSSCSDLQAPHFLDRSGEPGFRNQGYLRHAASVARVRSSPGTLVKANCQLGYYPKRLCIALETIRVMPCNLYVKNVFSHMSEWGVTQIVRQTCCLDHFGINSE